MERRFTHAGRPRPGLRPQDFADLVAFLETLRRPADDVASAEKVGKWSEVFDLGNVAAHAHVLPTGRVLFWPRHEPGETKPPDPQRIIPRLWDPETRKLISPPPDAPEYNVYGSGHAFLADGRLLVAGGTIRDGDGSRRASLYDPIVNKWMPVDDMNAGRWYPTVLALATGEMLVASGSFKTFPLPGSVQSGVNDSPQVLGTDGHWRDFRGSQPIPTPDREGNELIWPPFPFIHVAPDGNVFISGPLASSLLVNVVDGKVIGRFPHAREANTGAVLGRRDYGSSVMYVEGKVLVLGGSDPPTASAQIIDLNDKHPTWKSIDPMHLPRRQLNAAVLPDGNVFVSGGSKGPGFNNGLLKVLDCEAWDPTTGKWTLLAPQAEARLYNSTLVLLPDGRLLSAGGGQPFAEGENADHFTGQIYSPPYFFKGTRPVIADAPAEVTFGQTFALKTPDAASIRMVTWIRLPSVTHAFNQNQRMNYLSFSAIGQVLHIKAPANANLAPPGHYILFLLNANGSASVARIIRIR